jgi:hypothetical protein
MAGEFYYPFKGHIERTPHVRNQTALEEFLNASQQIVRDIVSESWDGADPIDLSAADALATAGFAFDSSEGAAQFMGNFFLGGDFVMITGGQFMTAASGERIQFTHTNLNAIDFFSGDVDELAAGAIREATNGTGNTRTIQFGHWTPQIEQTTATQIDAVGTLVLRSGSPDGTTFAPGLIFAQSSGASGGGQDLEFRIQNAIPFITDGPIRYKDRVAMKQNMVMPADSWFSTSAAGGFGHAQEAGLWDNRWDSSSTSFYTQFGSNSETCTMDMQTSKNLTKIKIIGYWFTKGRHSKDVKIETSPDNSTWTTHYHVAGNNLTTQDGWVVKFTTPHACRYVRVSMNGNTTNTGNYLTQFMVWEDAS